MKNSRILALSLLLALPVAATAVPLDLSGEDYFTYGNVNSYSLPIGAIDYAADNGGGTGPGNPFYVPSSPGQIMDQVVIYTGASGTGVTTNADGFDDAYEVPNGSQDPYASISGAVNMDAPVNKTGIANNDPNTWDANLLALKGFLDGGDPLFLFNNNETKADQTLAIWAKLWLTNSVGDLYGRYLYLSNRDQIYGTGGKLNGDATKYDPGNVLPTLGYDSTDYVASGGTVCTTVGSEVICVNHNLGANQVAYAADVPLLNAWLDELFNLNDAALGGYTLHLDLRLGCDNADDMWLIDGMKTCNSVKIDNGFEQLFLVSSLADIAVPEPGSLALLGLALAGLGFVRVRKS